MADDSGSSSAPETNHSLAEIKRDHSAFLSTFEKHTQIYRILAGRQQANPMFLQRNLSFYPRTRSPNPIIKPVLDEARKERKDWAACITSDSWLELSVKGVMEMGSEEAPVDREDQSLGTAPCPPSRFNVSVYCHRSGDLSAGSDNEFLGSCYATLKPLYAGRGRPRKAEKISIPTSKLLLSAQPRKKVWLEFRVQKEETPPTASVSPLESSMALRNKSTKKKKKLAATPSEQSHLADHRYAKKRRLTEVQGSAGAGSGGESSQSTLDSQSSESVSKPKKRKTSYRKLPQVEDASPKVYTATLCVFDSRQSCLLEDGQYILLMDRAGEGGTYCGQLSPLTWRSVFGLQDRPLTSSELQQEDCVKLKLSIAWIGGAPQDRILFVESSARRNREMRSTYDSLLPNLRRRDAQLQVDSHCQTEEEQAVVYNFLYDGGRAQQTEPRDSFRCPWCQVNCQKVLPLLMHLQLNHSRFTFSYTPLHMGCMVDVRVQDNWDQQSQTELDQVLPFSQIPSRRGCNTELIVWRGNKKADKRLSDFLPQANMSIFRTRQYYHTHTHLPVLEDEYDSDSEAEDTPQWVKSKMMQMIDEFSDISRGEKEIMKMWNIHALKERIIAVSQVPGSCLRFAQLHREELVENRLVYWYLIHLARLQELGIVNGTCILQAAAILHTGELPAASGP